MPVLHPLAYGRKLPPKKPPNPWDPASQQAWKNIQHGFGLQPNGTPYPPAVKPPSGPPPATQAGQAQRDEASGRFGISTGNTNRDLMQAAQRYGGTDKVTQVGVGADGKPIFSDASVVADPNSEVATINRNTQFGLRDIDEERASGNTFFSGLHQRQRGERTLEGDRQLGTARQGFDDLVHSLTTGWQGDLLTRGTGIAEGNQTDINAANDNPPPPGPVPPQDMPNPAPTGKMLAFQAAQARGQTKQKNGKWYYRRADGKWIPM